MSLGSIDSLTGVSRLDSVRTLMVSLFAVIYIREMPSSCPRLGRLSHWCSRPEHVRTLMVLLSGVACIREMLDFLPIATFDHLTDILVLVAYEG
jgi:hypothetical protein